MLVPWRDGHPTPLRGGSLVGAWWSQAGRAMAGAAVLGPALAAQGCSGQELVMQMLLQPELRRILGMGRWNLTSHRCRTQGWDVGGGLEGAQSSWELFPPELCLAFPRGTGQVGQSGEGQAERGQCPSARTSPSSGGHITAGHVGEKKTSRPRRDLTYMGRVTDGLCGAAEVAKTPSRA